MPSASGSCAGVLGTGLGGSSAVEGGEGVSGVEGARVHWTERKVEVRVAAVAWGVGGCSGPGARRD